MALIKIVNLLLIFFPFMKSNDYLHLIFRCIFVFFALAVIAVGSIRVDGVDYLLYAMQFKYPDDFIIPDIGYRYFNVVASHFFGDFRLSLVMISVIGMVSLYRASKCYNVHASILISIYLIHFLLLRDLAQVRFAFSGYIFIFALTIRVHLLRHILFLVAISIHYSMALLYIAIILYKWGGLSFAKMIAIFILSVLCIQIFSEYIIIIDDRILAYSSWQSEVEKTLIDHILSLAPVVVLALLFQLNRYQSSIVDLNLKLMLISIVIYVLTMPYSYIQGRVASIFMTLYPIGIASILSNYDRGRNLMNPTNILIILFLSMHLIRMDTMAIVDSMSW